MFLDIINSISSVLTLAITALVDFNSLVLEAITSVNGQTAIINGGGSVQGLNIIKFLGAYHYLVGPLIYSATWSVIIIGIMYSIFQLCLLIKNMLAGSGGMLSSLSNLFKFK